MFKKGACYIRVSTDNQTEFSPDAQLKAIRNYAKNNNIILEDEYVFIDEGISGRKANKRPAFLEMIKVAKSKPKKFDVILVHKFDRFARSREDSVVYKSLLKKECGIKVISITESIEDDKFSVILEAMLEAMAEYYSLNLSDEVKKGMTEKAERGQYQSSPPFGYKMENGKLVIIDTEAEAVKIIFEKYKNKELNILQIAKYLNNLGYRTHRGNKFENRTIEYILNNPVYCGMARWTPTGKIRRNYNCADTIIKKSQHEAIITEELFNDVADILNQDKEIYRRYYKPATSNIHWLNGLIKCKYCGSTFVRNIKKFYQCNGYVKGKCEKSQLVKISNIENSILNQIHDDLKNNTITNIKMRSHNTDNELHFIYSQLEKMSEKEDRIKQAYINGIDSLEEYKENKKYLENQKEMLNNKLSELRSKNNLQSKSSLIKEQLQNVYEILTDANIDMKRKHEVSHMLIENIVFSRDERILELTYKL